MKRFQKLTTAALALIMSAASAGTSMFCTMPAAAADEPDPEVLQEYIDIMVNQVNDVRAANNLSELSILPIMNGYAQVRAEEAAELFSHTRPDGRMCFSVIQDDGFFYNYAGENIAAGNTTPLPTFEQWMNSEPHRINILGSNFTHIGIGYYYDPDSKYKYYWTMFLIGRYDNQSVPIVFDDQYIPERTLGDANGSHQIDVADANDILTYSAAHSAGISTYHATNAFLKAADVNGDGTVNAVDASIVLTYCAEVGAGNSEARLEDYIW
ncbi:MAG: hypothetical protein K2I93_09340 [Oscillospiraceae bacterium]|nr:hypothetical protein [Oscillospiraceae bacterium]